MSTQEKPPQYDQTCSLCGTPVRVVGNTTMNYESAYESLRAENKRLISASEELRRENQRLHLQWSAAMNARDEARAALETWETRWRNCNDRAKEERDELKAQLAKSVEFRAREREAFEAQLSAHKEIDALKSENERLRQRLTNIEGGFREEQNKFQAETLRTWNLSVERDAALAEVERLKAELKGSQEACLDNAKRIMSLSAHLNAVAKLLGVNVHDAEGGVIELKAELAALKATYKYADGELFRMKQNDWLEACKEVDALKAEVERLRADLKSKDETMESLNLAHTVRRDELKTRLAEAERLLDTIKDAPIWEVQEERDRLKALCGDMLAEWNAGRVYAPSDKLKIYERLQNYVEET